MQLASPQRLTKVNLEIEKPAAKFEPTSVAQISQSADRSFRDL
jgi:hypothetical protein